MAAGVPGDDELLEAGAAYHGNAAATEGEASRVVFGEVLQGESGSSSEGGEGGLAFLLFGVPLSLCGEC